MSVKDLFKEIANEAYNQSIIIDGSIFPIGFNTVIYNDNNEKVLDLQNEKNISCLNIVNEEDFYNLLEDYLELEKDKNRKKFKIISKDYDKEYYKLLITFLFSNATYSDFSNPNLFIKKYIDYLKDDTFNNYKLFIDISDIISNSTLFIENNSTDIRMETPNVMDFKIIDNDTLDEFILPSIYYGISDDTCYIYSILNKDKKRVIDRTPFQKKVNRKLYKIESNVDKNDSIINDVSMSSVFSLYLFINLLKHKNINKVKGVSFLPVRSLSREIVLKETDDINKKKEIITRNLIIQNNLTQKFIRTFKRVESQLSSFNVVHLPDKSDEYIDCFINKDLSYSDNKFLNNISIKL